MIAGTSFLLCDSPSELAQHWARALRSHLDVDDVQALLDKVGKGDAIALRCDDGLVLLTLRCDGQETIAVIELAVSDCSKVAAFKRQESAMLAVARDAGADRVVFVSDRRGMARLVGAQWERVGETFSRST